MIIVTYLATAWRIVYIHLVSIYQALDTANIVMKKADTNPDFGSRGWQYWWQEVH